MINTKGNAESILNLKKDYEKEENPLSSERSRSGYMSQDRQQKRRCVTQDGWNESASDGGGMLFLSSNQARQCLSMQMVCPNSSPFIRPHKVWNTTISPQLKEELSPKGGAELAGCLRGPRSQALVPSPQPTSVQVISDSDRCEPWLHAWKKEKCMTAVEMEDICWGLGI